MMGRRLALLLAVGLLIGPIASIVRADLSPEEVRKAISRAVTYLKRQQSSNGSWRERPGQPGGLPALCTLALLEAGVPTTDDHVKKALDYLERAEPKTTYAVALQTMVFCKANPRQYAIQIGHNVDWLEKAQIVDGPSSGGWSYTSPGGSNCDNSNSQFALLGLHEAQRAEVHVNPEVWRRAKAYWERCQNIDGSWGYFKGRYGTGSMTCAGIASMIITSDKVRQGDAHAEGDRIQCCSQADVDNQRIENAADWLGNHFSVVRNPGERGWLLYYLYALERVGRLTSQRFFHNQRTGEKYDWYREGTEYLVGKQDSIDGSFRGIDAIESDQLIATSLSLLFLSKGRRPTLMAKLEHGPALDWNQHRSDVNNLTRYVESRWKMDLTWQVVGLKASTVEDLLQSPVLYLCGSQSPLPSGDQEQQSLAQKIRDYLDRGGFLFAEGYCGGTGFDQGFRRLIELAFPEPEYQLQLLPPEHPIWHAEEPVSPQLAPKLLGLEFGCRTSIVYAPRDADRPSLSCLWELSRAGDWKLFTPGVQAKIKTGLAVGINVLAYATNRELRGKETTFEIKTDREASDPFDRGRLRIAKLRHPGGCNAAPRALVHLLEEAGRQSKIRTDTKAELILLTDDSLFDYHLVFMHGRSRFHLTPEEREKLKTYVERGGMLFADSICASAAFTDSFRSEMAEIFAKNKLEPIPPDAPLLTPAYGGFDLKLVNRRDPQPRTDGGPLQATVRNVPPELEGIKLGDRWAVVFSRYDISCALEKHDSLECRGYTRDDAARIGLNVILYSMQQ